MRELGGVGDLDIFRRFVLLCAGRSGQLLNLSSLGSDCGVSHTTAGAWRDRSGHEVDLVIDDGARLLPVEMKAGLTLSGALYDGLDWFCARGSPAARHGVLVYGGDRWQRRRGHTTRPWHACV